MVKKIKLKNENGGFGGEWIEVKNFIFRNRQVVIYYKNGDIEYADFSNVLCLETDNSEK